VHDNTSFKGYLNKMKDCLFKILIFPYLISVLYFFYRRGLIHQIYPIISQRLDLSSQQSCERSNLVQGLYPFKSTLDYRGNHFSLLLA